jgi:hypothetical protein
MQPRGVPPGLATIGNSKNGRSLAFAVAVGVEEGRERLVGLKALIETAKAVD